MKHRIAILTLFAALSVFSPAWSHGSSHSLSARAASVAGSSGGAVSLTAGGAFDPRSGLLQVRGALRITRAFTDGPFAGERAGETVRWEGANIIPSLALGAPGAGGGAATPAVTDDRTLVLQLELYRPGDRVIASRSAKMVVSESDLDAGQDGVQNVWIEGVGFGSADVEIR